MKKIADFVNHFECPLVNGIIFPDGKIQKIEVSVIWSPVTTYSVHKDTLTSVKILRKEKTLYWVNCISLNQLVDEKKGLEVLCGEASYGGDGFVAVVDLLSRKLVWLAFFTESNPFIELVIADGFVYATSTLDCAWKFNLKEPSAISVQCK